jgi:hypothetical protein
VSGQTHTRVGTTALGCPVPKFIGPQVGRFRRCHAAVNRAWKLEQPCDLLGFFKAPGPAVWGYGLWGSVGWDRAILPTSKD